ncbi:MAG TPA: hypothetical protein GX396_04110 [Tissierellia bacterium]|nr:hypothetical protein [Tissierellia bacterium]
MQIGKSTIILDNIKRHKLLEHTGGFLCQRLTKGSKTKAYRLIEAEKAEVTATEYHENLPSIFLEEVAGNWVKRDQVFLNRGIELLSDLSSRKLILLDEIGGFELLIDEFREKLYEVLLSSTPIIGVIKSFDNGRVMKNAIGINDVYYSKYKALRSFITDNNGIIVNVNNNNIESINNEIKSFLCNIV